MSIGGDICFLKKFLCCGLVRFCSVGKMKTTNHAVE